MREIAKHPEASFWVDALDQAAQWVEHTIERGGYDLETIFNAEATAVAIYSGFRRTARKRLLETSPPRLREALQQADARMKAARDAAREAYAARREQALREEAEQANKVTMLDERRRERETREQYADTGA